MVYPRSYYSQCFHNVRRDSFGDDASIVDDDNEPTTFNKQQAKPGMLETLMSPILNCVQPPLCHEFVFSSPSSPSPKTTTLPHDHDVLCGRGNNTNRHLGNVRFRSVVEANRDVYSTLTKKEKMQLARQIVQCIHSTDPPGRFLGRDPATGRWHDVGLPRSLEKTSQALREKRTPPDGSESCRSSSNQTDHGSRQHPVMKQPPSSLSNNHRTAPKVVIPEHLRGIYHTRSRPKTTPRSRSSPIPFGVYPKTSPPILTAPRSYARSSFGTPYAPRPGPYSVAPYPQLPPSQLHPRRSSPVDYRAPYSTPQRHPTATAVVTPQSSRNSQQQQSPEPLSPIGTPSSLVNNRDGKRRRTTAKNVPTNLDHSTSILDTSPARILSSDPLTATLWHTDETVSNLDTGSAGWTSILESKLQQREEEVAGLPFRRDASADSMDGMAALSAAAFLRLDESD